ncbi:hypothetical protein CCO03_01610 [Comamonas serinivorans]|uniref:Probable membrane transporter protein n=1 Tax=Comamonas serinivorans TaxID=1082851 RepID=A0A1Y0EIU3_9BURK|nr:sulfite exporter TauE/SafE family protein [Comamonas serinivorans]ARU03553.1 hypothetical protein CCO03_01610 [Comamonas serinivorans]
MQWSQYLLFFVLVGLASVAQNLTGFAFSLILVGLAGATGLMPIAEASNVAMLLSLVNGVTYLRHHPFTPDWRLLKPMLGLSIVGVGLGWALLSWLDGNTLNGLRMALGVVIVACAVLLMLQKRQQRERQASPPQALWLASLSSGLLGGLFSTAGPPIVYHLYRQPLAAELIRQCLVVQFLLTSLVRTGLVVGTGSLRMSAIVTTAVAVPLVWGVTRWQAKHPLRLPQGVVDALVCGLLLLAGLSLFVPR